MKYFITAIYVYSLCSVVLSDDRIIGGIPAAPNSVPYVAHLDMSSLFCGGSLIDVEWVVSAAHCYFDASYFHVVLGDHDLSKEEGTEQLIKPSKVITHPQYNSVSKDNDVMLIKLSEPAALNEFVQVAKLPASFAEPLVGESCRICGWGNVQSAGNVYPQVLRCIDLPVLATSSCNDVTSYNGLVKDNMMCIGYMEGGKDTCDGDSGGAAVCRDGLLSGIVSWGYGCAYPNFPGVYVKTSWFVDWMKDIMRYY